MADDPRLAETVEHMRRNPHYQIRNRKNRMTPVLVRFPAPSHVPFGSEGFCGLELHETHPPDRSCTSLLRGPMLSIVGSPKLGYACCPESHSSGAIRINLNLINSRMIPPLR